VTTANDIRQYLLTSSPWVNPDRTVDRIVFGDGDAPIEKAGVCWYPAIETLRAAHAAGCRLVVCHEPLFWRHIEPDDHWHHRPPGIAKRELLEGAGMVVLRAHDSWDQWPGIGIRDSWAAFLGFTDRVCVSEEVPNVLAAYEVPSQPLRSLAQHVADRVAVLGEDSVRVTGDPDRIVSRPSLGVGCFCPNGEMIEKGSDVLIMCYDGASYWESRERMHEMGAAVIVVEHGTSEMPGLENLCKHLVETFPGVAFEYFAEHVRPWTVAGAQPP
jgi:putative NIF3 family GTP cyclohydrolase 1 type 2